MRRKRRRCRQDASNRSQAYLPDLIRSPPDAEVLCRSVMPCDTSSGPSISMLFVKPERAAAMADRTNTGIRLRKRHGIQGDVHADPLGPRQILLVAGEVLDDLRLPGDALRANVVTRGIELDALGSGTVLQIGASARVRLTHRCEVCSHIAQHAGLSRLKVLHGRRGYLGVVVADGVVQVSDELSVTRERFTWVPEHILARTLWVVRRIPPGRVAPYSMLVRLIGAPRGYLRALPRAITFAASRGLAAHRVVNSHGELLKSLPTQPWLLAAEGVESDGSVVGDLGRYTWRPRGLYYKPLPSLPGQLALADVLHP